MVTTEMPTRKFNIVAKQPTGFEITSLDSWFRCAPPAGGKKQWARGYSALELASRWLSVPDVPVEVGQLLDSAIPLQGFIASLGIAERRTAFDEIRGRRAHDLVLLGTAGTHRTVVAIEGKSAESFGLPVGTALARARSKPRTELPRRIEMLRQALFPSDACEAAVDGLRYQLLFGIAGTLAEAALQQASQAVFLVHEFLADNVSQKAVRHNGAALDAFLAVLGLGPLEQGRLRGPFRAPGRKQTGRDPGLPAGVDLFIGKATVRLHGTIRASRRHHGGRE